MFSIVADLLTSVTTILFPIFASYKALRTSDTAQLTPWLMYWVVMALVLQVESFFDFILSWIPFYSWMRLILHLYLVMPGKQGATQIYEEHIDPFLTFHEAEIDNFISDAHEKAKAAGLKYAKDAVEWIRVNVLGLQPQPPSPPPSRQSSASYTQTLLSRFAIPSAKPSSSASGTSGDIYNLIGHALSSATALYLNRDAQAENLTASGNLIPKDIPAEDRSSYVNTQRERLRVLLQAFDREAYVLSSEPDRRSELGKSRSEADFDRIEVSEAEERYNGGGPGVTPGGGPGAWMPWNWGQRPPSRDREPEDDRDDRGGRDDRPDRDERYERHDRPSRHDRDDRQGRATGFDIGY